MSLLFLPGLKCTDVSENKCHCLFSISPMPGCFSEMLEKRKCQKEGALFSACGTYASTEGRMRCAAVLGRAAAALLGLLPPEVCATWLWIKNGDGDDKKQGWRVK